MITNRNVAFAVLIQIAFAWQTAVGSQELSADSDFVLGTGPSFVADVESIRTLSKTQILLMSIQKVAVRNLETGESTTLREGADCFPFTALASSKYLVASFDKWDQVDTIPTLQVWSLSELRMVKEIHLTEKDNRRIEGQFGLMDISHNARYALGIFGQSKITCWDLKNSEALYSIELQRFAKARFLDRSRRVLLSDGRVFDALTGEPAETIEEIGKYKTDVQVLGDEVFVCGNNSGVAVWNLSTNELTELAGGLEGERWQKVAVSRTGKYVAASTANVTSSFPARSSLYVWDRSTKELVKRITMQRPEAGFLEFGPDDSLHVLQGQQAGVSKIPIDQAIESTYGSSHYDAIPTAKLQFSPSGKMLIAQGFNTSVFDLASRKLLGHFRSSDEVEFNADESKFRIGMKVFDIVAESPPLTHPKRFRIGPTYFLKFDAEGNGLMAFGHLTRGAYSWKRLDKDFKEVESRQFKGSDYDISLSAVDFGQTPPVPAAVTSDGKQILLADTFFLKVVNAESGELIQTIEFDPMKKKGFKVDFSDDGNQIYLESGSSFVIWDVQTGKQLFQQDLEYESRATVAGKFLAVYHNSELKVVELATGKIVVERSLKEFGTCSAIGLSPDAKWLALSLQNSTIQLVKLTH